MSEFYVICNYDGKVTLKVWYFTSVKRKKFYVPKRKCHTLLSCVVAQIEKVNKPKATCEDVVDNFSWRILLDSPVRRLLGCPHSRIQQMCPYPNWLVRHISSCMPRDGAMSQTTTYFRCALGQAMVTLRENGVRWLMFSWMKEVWSRPRAVETWCCPVDPVFSCFSD